MQCRKLGAKQGRQKLFKCFEANSTRAIGVASIHATSSKNPVKSVSMGVTQAANSLFVYQLPPQPLRPGNLLLIGGNHETHCCDFIGYLCGRTPLIPWARALQLVLRERFTGVREYEKCKSGRDGQEMKSYHADSRRIAADFNYVSIRTPAQGEQSFWYLQCTALRAIILKSDNAQHASHSIRDSQC